jgi:hypothetical protein
MFNFNYEDGFKINYKYFPAISRALYLSTETISRPPQFHETIPLSLVFEQIFSYDLGQGMDKSNHGMTFVVFSLIHRTCKACKIVFHNNKSCLS